MKILTTLFIPFLFCCSQNQKPAKGLVGSNTVPVTLSAINYDSCKKQIISIKQKNKSGWQKLPIAQQQKIFTAAVAETIVPGWIGTKWDFNGTTEKPQQGYIACGYFVTTVLRDAGLNLARVKLAQCASEQMIQSLVQPQFIKRYPNWSIENFVQAVEQSGYGLYIVGLDNHTGIIYNDGNNIFFIHSTFVGTRNVQMESAISSSVLQSSKYKMLGKLSADERVLQRWIQ
jgi:hypothetical protein